MTRRTTKHVIDSPVTLYTIAKAKANPIGFHEYWDGGLPVWKRIQGKSGKHSYEIKTFHPYFSKSARMQWAKKDTAINKLKKYEIIRIARPDLPELEIHKIDFVPTVTETNKSKLTHEEQNSADVLLRFGENIQDAYDHFDLANQPEYRFFTTLPKKRYENLFPDAKFKSPIAFLREEDVVILKIMNPDQRVTELEG